MRAAEAAIAYERLKFPQVAVMGNANKPLRLVHEIMAVLQGAGR